MNDIKDILKKIAENYVMIDIYLKDIKRRNDETNELVKLLIEHYEKKGDSNG